MIRLLAQKASWSKTLAGVRFYIHSIFALARELPLWMPLFLCVGCADTLSGGTHKKHKTFSELDERGFGKGGGWESCGRQNRPFYFVR